MAISTLSSLHEEIICLTFMVFQSFKMISKIKSDYLCTDAQLQLIVQVSKVLHNKRLQNSNLLFCSGKISLKFRSNCFRLINISEKKNKTILVASYLQASQLLRCLTYNCPQILWHKPPSPSFNVDFLSFRPTHNTMQSTTHNTQFAEFLHEL